MRTDGAENAEDSRPSLRGMRIGDRPRCECGDQHPSSRTEGSGRTFGERSVHQCRRIDPRIASLANTNFAFEQCSRCVLCYMGLPAGFDKCGFSTQVNEPARLKSFAPHLMQLGMTVTTKRDDIFCVRLSSNPIASHMGIIAGARQTHDTPLFFNPSETRFGAIRAYPVLGLPLSVHPRYTGHAR
jgi:hypothetical protein